MVLVRPLDSLSVKPYLLLSRPGLRRWLLASDKELGIVILGAEFWGHPVGLLIAQLGETVAYLLDLYVQPEYRRVGIATTLLTALDEQVNDAGLTEIRAFYRAERHTDAFQQCLAKQQWMQPERSRIIFGSQVSRGVAEQPWICRFQFRAPFEVIAWADVTHEQQQVIRQRGEDGWFPAGLSPFNRPAKTWDAELSVALRCRGEILGWALAIRESADQHMVEVMFVDPPLQPLGRGILLVAELIRRAIAAGDEYGYWGVAPDNTPMLRWSRQAFGTALIDESVEWSSKKELAQNGRC